jgi:hypothetical protein
MKQRSGAGMSPVEALTLPHSAVEEQFRKDGTPVLIRSMTLNPSVVSTFVPGPRPGPDDTPYRSRFYVNESASADGLAYAPGDPIWEPEAERQGIIGINVPVVVPPAPEFTRCERCRGRGTYLGRDRAGNYHKDGCKCGVCTRLCKDCHGSGKTKPQEV